MQLDLPAGIAYDARHTYNTFCGVGPLFRTGNVSKRTFGKQQVVESAEWASRVLGQTANRVLAAFAEI